jgi:hypothetical protein
MLRWEERSRRVISRNRPGGAGPGGLPVCALSPLEVYASMSRNPLEQQISLSTWGSAPAGQGTHRLWVRYLSQRLVDAFLPRGPPTPLRGTLVSRPRKGVRIPTLPTTGIHIFSSRSEALPSVSSLSLGNWSSESLCFPVPGTHGPLSLTIQRRGLWIASCFQSRRPFQNP